MKASIKIRIISLLFSAIFLAIHLNNGLSQCTVVAISPTSMNAPSTAGQVGTVTVTTEDGCYNYNISNYISWASYQKNGHFVTVSVQANTGPARQGTMLIGNRPLTIYQACGNPTAPSSASSNRNNYCSNEGGNISLSVTGGSGTTLHWFSSSCGVTSVGTGNPLIISAPTSTSTYYARWENSCGLSSCVSVTVTVKSAPVASASSNSPVCASSAILLSSSGGSSYSWTGPDNFSSSDQNPVIENSTVEKDGNYSVVVTSSNGCTDDASANVTVGMGALKGSSNRNYIRTRIAREPYSNSLSEDIDPSKINTEYAYYDGLGRPIQTIQVKASPQMKDLVAHIEYDNFGRQKYDYLPYAKIDFCNNGAFVTSSDSELLDFYSYYLSDNYPYSEKVLEDSPLSRVLEQGAPGSYWQPYCDTINGSGHTVRNEYLSNDSLDVLIWRVVNDTLENIGGVEHNSWNYYLANTLYKNIIKDENWDSTEYIHTTVEFKNLNGDVILKRTYVENGESVDKLETYYAYDDFGLLRYVLPPKAVANLSSDMDTLTLSNNIIKGLCYYYEYDSRLRMILKQLPGADPIYMVYDKRDRLVLVQDGNNRPENKWLFTKYDILNRPVLTGILQYSTSESQAEMQTIVDNAYSGTNPAYYISRNSSLTQTLGYTDESFPNSSDGNLEYLTATYFDNYDFPDKSNFDININISEYSDSQGDTNYYDLVINQVTGNKVKVLGTTSYITTTNYYDDKYRIIQSLKNLFDDTNGKEVFGNNYDFVGNITHNRQKQVFNNDSTTVDKYYTYDHAGRLIKTESQINGGDTLIVSEMTYNELGQLSEKDLNKVNGSSLQEVNYQYNIRGWLTKINDPSNLGSDLFSMQVLYENPSILSDLTKGEQYNGNISGIIWNRKIGTTSTRKSAYSFIYDALNRITGNYYGEGSSLANSNAFREYDYSYDENGNILALKRNNNSGSTMDNLSYTYLSSLSNLLVSVSDNSGTAGFYDGNPSGNDYSYDKNGNLTEDLNKNISTIKYNYLNLPDTLIKDANNKLIYVYDAMGTKLKQVTIDDGQGTERVYLDGFEYNDDNSLSLIHMDEGIIQKSGENFEYDYFIKDHLGNTRIVTHPDGNNDPLLDQSVDYYAFGLMIFQYDNSSGNKYLFNGKELQDEQIGGVNLDWYDYGSRFMDPQIGRWTTTDPLAESYRRWSPYNYAVDNPIRFIDPDGMAAEMPNDYFDIITGKYIGTDKDKEHDDVRLISRGDWENSNKGNSEVAIKGSISLAQTKETQYILSHGHDKREIAKNISNYYYEEAGYNLNDLENRSMATFSTGDMGQTTYDEKTKILNIHIGVNKLGSVLNNKYDFINFMRHERGSHGQNFLTGKFYNENEWETEAYKMQIEDPSWLKCSPEFKNEIISIIKTYGYLKLH